ncbi:hypothetical protein LVD17_03385 [Fulvivirga ulvae]|uniref:hypothetical protein n=1 Tax=Fulvivirga ulvae TaxID=2904245 RepID=UPI001F1D76E0|nr:hypothetical protein [Fulvivirga ulvae]UII32874.1 hypothetical protein LVD17_03385 [Fulvivirga ulvae]
MQQIIEFFDKLFSSNDWPPRWSCGYWSDFHGWLYIGSDVTIWLAYFIIPVILFWLVLRIRGAPFLPVFWLFGAFIILCGFTHIMDAFMFWWPAYRINALIRFFTAIVSMITVFGLIKLLPNMLGFAEGISERHMPNKKSYSLEKIIQEKDRQIKELSRQLELLNHKNA